MMDSHAARRTVLVIEDNDDDREVFAVGLRAAGFAVFATGDPAQSVEMAAAREPDLVLCDIGMPVMDGYKVLRALQDDPRTRHLAVVFLTGYTDFAERVRAFRFGVVDYITKPVDPGALAAKVEDIIDGLPGRLGVAEASGPDARALIEDVTRDRRTGLLTLQRGGDQTGTRIVVKDGKLLTTLSPSIPSGSTRFEELDAMHEDLVAHDPPALAGSGPLPEFGLIPEPLREVVIADDNEMFRASLREVLARCGFRVREAADGDDLVRQALEKPPWLIVLDVHMPVMDGFAACRQLRAHLLTRYLPILFLSGWDDLSERAAALDAGADEFLSKRTSLRELLLRIQVLMRRYASAEKSRGAVIEGRLDVVGAPAALQMCHLLGLTGTLVAGREDGRIAIGFLDGRVATATAPASTGREAVFEFLCTQRGRFAFHVGLPEPGVGVDDAVSWLVFEGCRRIDQQLPNA